MDDGLLSTMIMLQILFKYILKILRIFSTNETLNMNKNRLKLRRVVVIAQCMSVYKKRAKRFEPGPLKFTRQHTHTDSIKTNKVLKNFYYKYTDGLIKIHC